MVRRRSAAARNAAAAVQSLADRMASLRVRPRRARRRVAINTINIPAAQGAVPTVVSSGRRRRRRNGSGLGMASFGAPIGNGGQITLSRSELFQTLTVAKGGTFNSFTTVVSPSSTIMTFLYRLTQCYTRMRWNSLSFEWKPAVGTSQAGIITYGLRLMDDRAAQKSPTSRAEVSALYPVNDHPVWQRAVLPVAKDLLMSRKWYATRAGDAPAADALDLAPGSLIAGVDAPAAADKALFVGEFWVTYSVTLDGNRSEN